MNNMDIFKVACPGCGIIKKATPAQSGSKVQCSCGATFLLKNPFLESSTPSENDDDESEEDTEANGQQGATSFLLQILVVGISTVLGIAIGCIVGFFAAHHFAFFGGLALLGNPYSPARYSLVPGHMLLCGIILGMVGFGLGFLFCAIFKLILGRR